MVPDHAPEAEQDVAFVEDQVSIEVPPLVTDVGFAANDTAGSGPIGPTRGSSTSAPTPPQPERPRVKSRVEENMTAKIFDPTCLTLDIREARRINLTDLVRNSYATEQKGEKTEDCDEVGDEAVSSRRQEALLPKSVLVISSRTVVSGRQKVSIERLTDQLKGLLLLPGGP